MQTKALVVIDIQNNITASTRTFKPGTRGEELVSEMKVVSQHAESRLYGTRPLRLYHQLRPEKAPRDARLLRKQGLRGKKTYRI